MSASKSSRNLLIGIICLCAAIAFGILAIVTNIFEKKQEGKNPFFQGS